VKPFLEKLAVPADTSWRMLDRRLEDGIPFQWHHHPEYELTLTLNSRGQRYVGDDIGSYDDGDLVLLGPNLPHTWCSSAKIDPDQPHVALVMWFKAEWAAALMDVLTELEPLKRMLASAQRGLFFPRRASQAVRPIIEAMPALKPTERLIRLMEVLTALSQHGNANYLTSPRADQPPISLPNTHRIDRVLGHIHEHYLSDISISTLAELSCLSLSGFHRMFRRHTQMSVTEYVAQLRIGQACSLLISTELPISHVADMVGYANLANFNHQFKALKKMTPREFRKVFEGKSARS
jgi:AraC-like DNA-binding protein